VNAEFRFNHIALNVRDLAASARFYGEVLELEEIVNKTGNAAIRWFAFDGNREIHLITSDGALAAAPHVNTHIALATPHFDATLKSLAEKGVVYESVRGEKMKYNLRGDGVKQCYFRDPDDYWIEVCESDRNGKVG
jgi:lactoylglutathione lyase